MPPDANPAPDAGHRRELHSQFRVPEHHVDQMGVVHHSHYLGYFEAAALDLLAQLRTSSDPAAAALPRDAPRDPPSDPPRVRSFEIRYSAPARLGDTLEVIAALNEVREDRQLVFKCRLERRDPQPPVVVAEATLTIG